MKYVLVLIRLKRILDINRFFHCVVSMLYELRRREGSVQNHSKITVRTSPSNCMWGFDLKGIVLGFLNVFLDQNGFLRKAKRNFQLK